MKKNIDKLVKKVLTEQGLGTAPNTSDEITNKITNDELKLAYLAGCFPKDGIPYEFNGKQVFLKKNSTKVSGFPNAILHAPETGKNFGILEYYDNNLTNKDSTSRTWTCAALRTLIEDPMNNELIKFVKDVRDSTVAQIFTYGDESVKDADKVNGTCKLITLKDFIDSNPTLRSRQDVQSLLGGNKKFIWKCTYQVGATNLASNPVYKNLKTAIGDVAKEQTKQSCQKLIENYYSAFKRKLPIPQTEISDAADYVVACKDNEEINVNNFLSKKYSKILEELQYAPTYKFRNGSTVSYRLSTGSESFVRESVLKKIIRENLNELSESKKKSLVEEYNIINTRFKIISEAGKPKTKKQKEKFVDDLLSEMFYLKSQGFNDILINEQFLDIIKSFFGQVPGGIFDTIKERFIQLILEKLGVGTEGYLANIFIATIGDIPIGDYANGKIFNCEYLSNAISKGVGEGIARKIQKEQGMEGYLYDIIRNSLVDMFTDSSFGQKIEGAIADLVCPSISKIKDKMDLAGETMKEKALS